METRETALNKLPSIDNLSEDDLNTLQQNRQFVIKVLLESRDLYLKKKKEHQLPADLETWHSSAPLISKLVQAIFRDTHNKRAAE